MSKIKNRKRTIQASGGAQKHRDSKPTNPKAKTGTPKQARPATDDTKPEREYACEDGEGSRWRKSSAKRLESTRAIDEAISEISSHVEACKNKGLPGFAKSGAASKTSE